MKVLKTTEQRYTAIGFANKFHTLWEVLKTEKQFHTGAELKYTYIYKQNLTNKGLEVAMEKAIQLGFKNVKVEENLKGQTRTFTKTDYINIEIPENCFKFGKYKGLAFDEIEDPQYLKWYYDFKLNDLTDEQKDFLEKELDKHFILFENEYITKQQFNNIQNNRKVEYFGEIKKRYEEDLQVVKVNSFNGYYGTTWITILEKDNHTFCYKGNHVAKVGETVKVKFTVKAHELYGDIKQTQIARPKIIK